MSIAKSRLPLVRRQMALALGEFSDFTNAELLAESASLHAALATAADFSPLAARALRATAIAQLLQIDREHERRQLPAPRPIRPSAAPSRPAAA